MLEMPFIQKSSDLISAAQPVQMPHSGVQGMLQSFDADLRTSPEVASYLSNARLLMKHKEYSLALNILRQASNKDSKHPITLDLLGDCLEVKHNFSEALIVRRVQVSVDYGFESLFKFATTLYKMNKDDESLNKYYEALSLLTEESDSLFELYKNMGNIFVRQGDFDGAEEYYSKAYTLNAKSDTLLVNFGTLEVQRNDFGKSLYCFRQAIEANSENDKAWVGLAMVHNHFGDVELAWANLESALDINPKNRTAAHLLANWAVRDSQFQKGISALETYLSSVEQDEEMSLVLLNIYCMNGDVIKAQLEIERVLLWNPDRKDVRELKSKVSHLRAA